MGPQPPTPAGGGDWGAWQQPAWGSERVGGPPAGAASGSGSPVQTAVEPGRDTEGLRAAGCGSLVLRDTLRAVREDGEVLFRLPLVGIRGEALRPQHQVRPRSYCRLPPKPADERRSLQFWPSQTPWRCPVKVNERAS